MHAFYAESIVYDMLSLPTEGQVGGSYDADAIIASHFSLLCHSGVKGTLPPERQGSKRMGNARSKRSEKNLLTTFMVSPF